MLRISALFLCGAAAWAATVRISPDNIFLLDGKPAFPLGFTTGPPPGALTPEGKDGYRELTQYGMVLQRCRVAPGAWKNGGEAYLDKLMEASAKAGMLCAIYIGDLVEPKGPGPFPEAEVARVVRKYKDHPAMGIWKGADEPEWGKVPVDKVRRFYDIVHRLDPAHPVWITQAPRGTIESLKVYDPGYDVAAIDIYPIGYPPGGHSHLPNKNISVVGDYANWLREITGGRKPFWMVLQIAWSGVIKPDKTLRYPTFPEERYMSYQSVINGARGLLYFGGDIAVALNERDQPLGWNWTFYDNVLKRVLREFAADGPLGPALIAPDSKLAVRVEGASGIEFRVREAAGNVYLLAAKREGATQQATFRGLPAALSGGDVLFEAPRKATVKGGTLTDWFGPNEVHVYRLR